MRLQPRFLGVSTTTAGRVHAQSGQPFARHLRIAAADEVRERHVDNAFTTTWTAELDLEVNGNTETASRNTKACEKRVGTAGQ